MRRRLIALCVLAYPRSCRRAEGEFLRDLTLDFAETNGFGRQLGSLVRGGFAERIRLRRPRTLAHSPRRMLTRAVAVAAGVAAIVAALALFGSADTDVEVHSCVETRSSSDHGCADVRRLAADKERDGWECTARRQTVEARLMVDIECRRDA